MAERIVSPGVFTNEIDQSFLPSAVFCKFSKSRLVTWNISPAPSASELVIIGVCKLINPLF